MIVTEYEVDASAGTRRAPSFIQVIRRRAFNGRSGSVDDIVVVELKPSDRSPPDFLARSRHVVRVAAINVPLSSYYIDLNQWIQSELCVLH